MSEIVEIRVPDLGEFSDVEVIEVHVAPGDSVVVEDPLISLETDKATMDVPSPVAGTINEIKVLVGDKVSTDTLIVSAIVTTEVGATPKDDLEDTVIGDPDADTQIAEQEETNLSATSTTDVGATFGGKPDLKTRLVVLGSGPGGYTAAFRAADLGIETTLVERWNTLGGVCLNVGCIPSKALLHAAKVIDDALAMRDHGVSFGGPVIDTDKLRQWKNKVVARLTGGLTGLAAQRKVNVLHCEGRFLSVNHMVVTGPKGATILEFEQCIIAAGSESAMLPGLPDDPRIIDSTGALELGDLPDRMLVIGGGIIGLEMATVYAALGVKVSVVELTDSLMPGCDRDLVRPLQKCIEKSYEHIMLATAVKEVTAGNKGIKVRFDGKADPGLQTYDCVLVSVGRKPNGAEIDADKAGVYVDEGGFIPVDKQMRTNVPHIFAIGDIIGQPMLAHKASHEGKVASEVISGEKRAFDARAIPSVAYTDPEIAWVGLTEIDAKAQGIAYEKGTFPWAASGRSLSLGRDEGMTKLLFDPSSGRLLGAGIVGPNAGDLIAEAALAIEMGCDAEDISLTIHPHPTLSETIAFAAEAFNGTLTDLYIPKKKR